VTIPLPIETERLLLRPLEARDVEPMLAVYGDAEVMRFIPGGVLDAAATARVLSSYVRAQETRGFAVWGVVLKSSGRLIGDAGFNVFAATGEPELGYSLARAAWGHGYASEAARGCLDAAFAHLACARVLALVDVDNDASQRVAERIGMARLETIDAHGRPHVLFERRREAA
jgi:ribosomal-protein-alanine N-acetyltransferase